MNNGRIIMGSFGVTNPLMNKTAGGSTAHHRFSSSQTNFGDPSTNQTNKTSTSREAAGGVFASMKIQNASATLGYKL